MGKYLVFVYRPSDEGARSENRRQIFSVQTEQTRLIRNLLYGLRFIIVLKFATLFLFSDFAVTLSCQLFCVASCLHQFGFNLS